MSQYFPLFTRESFEDIIEIARMDVNISLQRASSVPDDQLERLCFYLHMYAIHMSARLGFNGHLNGCYKTEDECLIKVKNLLEIEHQVVKERHEDCKYYSMKEMHNGQRGKVWSH